MYAIRSYYVFTEPSVFGVPDDEAMGQALREGPPAMNIRCTITGMSTLSALNKPKVIPVNT